MFKISFFIRKKKNIDADTFKKYWLGEHAELQKKYLKQIGVRQFVKSEILHDNPYGKAFSDAYGAEGEAFDFIEHWVFNDIEDLKKGYADPQVLSVMRDVYASEDKFIDTHRCSMSMSVDVAQFYSGERPVASVNNNFIKVYYCARVYPELTRDQAQLHWNACHGAVSRQEIAYSVLSRYVQAHNIDSTFVDTIVKERGYESDPQFIGQAETWLDTSAPEKDFPEEDKAEVSAMSMDDIALFADKKVSQCLVAKEHFIIDEKIITRPMPKFFSAVY